MEHKKIARMTRAATPPRTGTFKFAAEKGERGSRLLAKLRIQDHRHWQSNQRRLVMSEQSQRCKNE